MVISATRLPFGFLLLGHLFSNRGAQRCWIHLAKQSVSPLGRELALQSRNFEGVIRQSNSLSLATILVNSKNQHGRLGYNKSRPQLILERPKSLDLSLEKPSEFRRYLSLGLPRLGLNLYSSPAGQLIPALSLEVLRLCF